MIQAYHESLLSQLYPGQQHSSNCLIPAVLTFEERLCLPSEHRAKVVWRLDRGFGGDENINWLLERDYQVLAKGCSHRRTAKLVDLVQRWRQVRADRFVGCAVASPGEHHHRARWPIDELESLEVYAHEYHLLIDRPSYWT